MTQLWTECDKGKCLFRTPDGKTVPAIPAQPNHLGKERVYEAIENPLNHCGSFEESPLSCDCFIVVQRKIRKTGAIDTESVYKGNAASKNNYGVPGGQLIEPLTQKQRDEYAKEDRDAKQWVHQYLAVCLKLVPNKHNGRLEVVRTKP